MPGVARIQKTSNAQHWHQRLGHIAQNNLKKTKDHSLGLEGINTSGLKICQICNLSKAQQYVLRDPRPTLYEPLDEVFVDTAGKLVPSVCHRSALESREHLYG